MSGDRFVDGPLGLAYSKICAVVEPVRAELVRAGISELRAGFLAYQLARLVLEKTDSWCSFADFLTWESSADGE